MRTLPLALFVVCVSRVQRRAALLLPARSGGNGDSAHRVATQSARGKCVLDHLAAANKDANYRLEDLRSRKFKPRSKLSKGKRIWISWLFAVLTRTAVWSRQGRRAGSTGWTTF